MITTPAADRHAMFHHIETNSYPFHHRFTSSF